MQELVNELLQKMGTALESYVVAGSLLAYALVFLGGMLVSLTPCVYPVIPITVGYIGGQAGGSRMRGFVMSVVYVLGMAMVYTAMGAAAAITGKLFGRAASSPLAFFIVGNICILMALSMLGVFSAS